MKEVVNLHTQPLSLESGVILAAAGTDGSVKTVEELSDGDKRLVDAGLILVRDKTQLRAVPASKVVDADEAGGKEKK